MCIKNMSDLKDKISILNLKLLIPLSEHEVNISGHSQAQCYRRMEETHTLKVKYSPRWKEE